MIRTSVTDFAALLQLLREEARLTQEELAEAAGLGLRTISDLERGVHPTARKATAGMLAGALGLTAQVRVRFVQAARGLCSPAEVLSARAGLPDTEKSSAEAGTPGGPAVRYSLPPDNAAFTGRDGEMGLITAAVASAAADGGVVAITGMPGVGKTALAVHAAHLLRGQFPDRQLFIDLHAHTPGQDPVPSGSALAGLLTAVGVDARYLPQDTAARASLWRDRMAGQRSLLVLDNAASSNQIAPLLPAEAGCLVLITSRRHLGDLPGAAVSVLADVLPADHAQQMFLRLAPGATAGPHVAELVRLAGFLPLAISLLARVGARHPSWSLADLTAETRASMLTLAAERDSVAAAFDVSYRYLPPGQQRFLRCLGLHPGTTIDRYAAAALAGIRPGEASEHLDALHREALLTEYGYRRYGMHDLIRRYARQRADADPAVNRGLATDRVLDFYQNAVTLAGARLAPSATPPAITADPASLPCLPDSDQALAWARAERANLLACLDLATESGQHARVIALTAGLAPVLLQDGPWAEAMVRHATAAAAAQHCGDRQGRATALCNLGVIARRTGDYQASGEALERALRLYRELDQRQGQADVLRQLGALIQVRGDIAGAARALGEALAISRDLGDRPGQAATLCLLGSVRHQTGDYPGAARALEEALAISRDLGDPLGEANALNALGEMRRRSADYPGAAQVLQAALAIYRDLGYQLGQANALTNLGVVRRMTGDHRGAIAALEAALPLYTRLGSRSGQANVHLYLGSLRRMAGDYTGAAQALDAALGIYRALGEQGSVVEALNEAGTLHRECGAITQARHCHTEALDQARAIDSAWDQAHALAGLARCHLAAGRTAAAQAGLTQAQSLFQRIGAADAADVAAELAALRDTGVPDTPGRAIAGQPVTSLPGRRMVQTKCRLRRALM